MSLLGELIAELRALIGQVHEAENALRDSRDRSEAALNTVLTATEGSTDERTAQGAGQWWQAIGQLEEAVALLAGGNASMAQYIAGPLLGGAGGGAGSSASSESGSPPVEKSRAAAPQVTRPSLAPDPGRKPRGSPEPVDRGSSSENQAAIRGENDAAIALARSGYDIEQKPPSKPNGKRPDYFMEGDYWDCYTVFTSSAERVRKSIKKKVGLKDGQTQADRIVLNLDVEHSGKRTTLTPAEIGGLLRRKPIADLKELKVIGDGRVHDLDLGDQDAA